MQKSKMISWQLLVVLSLSVHGNSHADIFRLNLKNRPVLIPGTEGIDTTAGVDLDGLDLHGAILRARMLGEATFNSSNLRDADFQAAHLRLATFNGSDLRDADLSRADLRDASFTGAIIAGVDFSLAVGLTFESIEQTASYQQGDLRGVIFPRWTLQNADLSHINFADTDLRGTYNSVNFTGSSFFNTQIGNFDGANLTNADLTFVKASGKSFETANLDGAIIDRADFSRAKFVAESFYQTQSYSQRQLNGIRLSFVEMDGWNLADQELHQADLGGASLRNASLENAKLIGARLSSAKLDGADFSGARIENANLRSSNLSAPQLYATASYQSKNLRGVNLTGINTENWDLSGQTLSYASIWPVGVKFTDAVISYADLGGDLGGDAHLLPDQLRGTASYRDKDLRGIRISGDFGGFDFSEQNLDGANLRETTLHEANFVDAKISGIQFPASITREQVESTISYQQGELGAIGLRGRELAGWSFRGQNLNGADLHGSSVEDVSFEAASISGADLGGSISNPNALSIEQLYATHSYAIGDLTAVQLAGSRLVRADLSSQDLTDADLSDSWLRGANFQNAILRNANFESADVVDADFTGAVIDGIRFPKLMTQEQLATTKSFQRGDMRDLDFSGVELSHDYDFAGQDLSGANFRLSQFGTVNLSGASLANADFELSGTRFTFSETTTYNQFTVLPNVAGAFLGPEPTFVPTAAGDANFDGKVSFSDFLALSSHFGDFCDRGWSEQECFAIGDFDLDGRIAFSDFLAFSANFNATQQSVPSVAVPEPLQLPIVWVWTTLVVLQSQRNKRGK